MLRNPHRAAYLLVFLLVAFVWLGCSDVKTKLEPVAEVVVEFARETGEWVSAKASTLARAMKLAWRKLFPEMIEGVAIDAENPLMGVHKGTYKSVIKQGGHEITYKLLDPIMERESVDSTDWSPSLANIPKHMREAFAGD